MDFEDERLDVALEQLELKLSEAELSEILQLQLELELSVPNVEFEHVELSELESQYKLESELKKNPELELEQHIELESSAANMAAHISVAATIAGRNNCFIFIIAKFLRKNLGVHNRKLGCL